MKTRLWCTILSLLLFTIALFRPSPALPVTDRSLKSQVASYSHTSLLALSHTGLPELALLRKLNAPLKASRSSCSVPTLLQEHDPIYICNDTDLLQQASAEGWPGSGTLNDPIVISGYSINASRATSGAAGIHIENVSLYLVIRNCFLYNGSFSNKHGLSLQNTSHTTVDNLTTTSNLVGFLLSNCSNCIICNCTADSNLHTGFAGTSCSNCMFLNCFAVSTVWWGFSMSMNCCNCTLANCTARSNVFSFLFFCVQNCTLANCTSLQETGSSYIVWGTSLTHYTSQTISNCFSGGKPVLYIVNQTVSDLSLNSYGTIILVNSSVPSVISGYTPPRGGVLELAYTTPTTVLYSNASIVIHHSDFNQIRHSTELHAAVGIWLFNAHHCMVFNCTTSYCYPIGTLFWYCSDCRIENCTACNASEDGVRFWSCTNCSVVYSNCSFNSGCGVSLWYCTNCTLTGSEYRNNSYSGVRLHVCNDSLIFNNLFNNTQNLLVYHCNNVSLNTTAYTPGPNIVGGSYLGGNYWNNYTGTDANRDGYGDTPYAVTDSDTGAVFYDHLPLVLPAYLRITHPKNGVFITESNVTVRWVYFNPYAALDHFEICVSNASWSTGWINVGANTEYTLTLYDSTYTANVTAFDVTGDVLFSTTSFTIDTQPPSVHIVDPADGAWFNTSTVTVVFDYTDANLDQVWLFNGTNWLNVSGLTSYTCQFPQDGSYILRINATDKAGWTASTAITIHIDTKPPTVSIIDPKDDSWLSSLTVCIQFTYADANVQAVHLFNGTNWVDATGLTSYTCYFCEDGSYTLTVKVYDRAGWISSSSVTIHIDTTPPNLSVFSPKNGTTTTDMEILVEWAGSDTGIGIDHYEIRAFNQTWDSGWINVGTQTNYTLSLAPGNYTIQVRAIDHMRHSSLTTIHITIQTAAEQPSAGEEATPTPSAESVVTAEREVATRNVLLAAIGLIAAIVAISAFLLYRRKRTRKIGNR